ncbi:MAG: (2Fe-2S)-binding protein [Acidobacteria bacterium]|nr:(2Fe-2S)-binding protein [Acidobacteriota bacterium]
MERADQDRVICRCLQVTERQLRAAVEQSGVQTVRELIHATEAGTGCTACHGRLEGCLTRWSSPPPPVGLSEPARETYASPSA